MSLSILLNMLHDTSTLGLLGRVEVR
jgi:hypothetical protein